MPSEIQLDNISYSYGGESLFADVSFTIGNGRIVVLMGSSGCGKSTLLEISAGLLVPATGTVRWNGYDIHSLPQQELVAERRKTGYVFQQHALICNLTVFDNIALPLRYHTTMPDKALRAMIEQHLERMGILDIRNKLPEALSVGQARLVSIARALIMRPEFLFLDEPVSGLDPVTARSVISILKKLCLQSNLTIFMVSHIISFIEQLQCPILLLDNKTITGFETVEQARAAKNASLFVASTDEVI
jgi:phospholipid/cholesterol/gamma-HCH transport system ATP-binding protein